MQELAWWHYPIAAIIIYVLIKAWVPLFKKRYGYRKRKRGKDW